MIDCALVTYVSNSQREKGKEMHRFDVLANCDVTHISLGESESVLRDTYSSLITYCGEDLVLRLVATDLRVRKNERLAVLTFRVEPQAEQFFTHLDTILSVSVPTLTDCRICVTTSDFERLPKNLRENNTGRWIVAVHVGSVYTASIAKCVINSLVGIAMLAHQ